MITTETDVTIIGAGPVGLFSAFQAGMLNMKTCIIDSLDKVGGQCSTLYPEKPIYDIPGFSSVTGQSLIDNLEKQANQFCKEYYMNQRVDCIKAINQKFETHTSTGICIQSKAVIISAGCGLFEHRKPKISGIDKCEGKSVFYSVQNKNSLRGKRIAIVGGGDSAVDWAIELSEIAEKIYLIHRRNKFRCVPESYSKARSLTDKIEFVTPYQLHALSEDNGYIKRAVVKDLDNNERNLNVNTLLSFFGMKQNVQPIEQLGVQMKNGLVHSDISTMQTSISGVYAIGDIATYEHRQKLILVGFAEASKACYHMYSKVHNKELHFEYSTSNGIFQE